MSSAIDRPRPTPPVEILRDGVDDDQVDGIWRHRLELCFVEDLYLGMAGIAGEKPAADGLRRLEQQQRPARLRQCAGGDRVAAAPIEHHPLAADRHEATDAG